MKTVPTLIFCFLASFAFAEPPKVLEEFNGKVVGITDGDTLTVRNLKETITIRLEGIDAPEKHQPFGTKSKEHLSSLVHNKRVQVKKTGVDKYGRTLGYVIANGMEVNARMISDGYAWHFAKYNTEERLTKLEESAKAAKRGLWSEPNPVPPWEFRAHETGNEKK